ncbi:MAG: cell division protein ZipA, partial [Kangiellaceae bacterium]
TLVRNLDGELRDERRTLMSEQSIEHCRQRIRDFERRRLMRVKSN